MWRSLFSPLTLLLTLALLLASFLPAEAKVARFLDGFNALAVFALFFLYGARLSRQALWTGLKHGRLHVAVLASTFVLFPLLTSLALSWLGERLNPALLSGLWYLAFLPSTVQSSIVFTSIAGGNLSAAICSASLSSILGVFLTPLCLLVFFNDVSSLAALDFSSSFLKVSGQILLPFVLGQVFHRRLASWLAKKAAYFKPLETGMVLLMVYSSFSASVLSGLWTQFAWLELLYLTLICLLLLLVILAATWFLGGVLAFSPEDRLVLLFCGSKKSLVTGVPMAQILFAQTGALLLPLMMFHQLQLMLCAALAEHFAKKNAP